MPINVPFVGLQTAAVQKVLYLQAGSGIALTQDPIADTLTVTNTGSVITPAALTVTNDTNVTLTLGGSPAAALLAAASITAGWTGTLAAARLNANVVQGVTNDTNVTGSIAAQVLTLGWTGTLAAGRLNANVVQSIVNDTNVTGSIAAQALTLGWTGTLAVARGGTGAATLAGAGIVTGSGTTGKIPKWSSANALTDSVIQESSGNVGIGTTSPVEKLQITDASNANIFLTDNAVSTNQYGGIIRGYSLVGKGGYLALGTKQVTNVDAITIDYHNFVGIGTTSPSGLLHVQGSGDIVAFASGGLAIGGTSDPGAGVLKVATDILGAPCSLMFAVNALVSPGGAANSVFIWGTAVSTVSNNATAIAERAMVFSRLYVYLRVGQGANGSFVATLIKNGIATALSVNVPASSAAGAYADTTHTVSVAAGDLITINLVNNDTGVNTSIGSVSVLSVSN